MPPEQEGSIVELEGGGFAIRYILPDGKRKQECRPEPGAAKFRSRSEARRWFNATQPAPSRPGRRIR